MASTGLMPTYQRFVNGVPVPAASSRRSLRTKEKYLLALVFLTFTFVCFGAIFFLPEFKSVASDNHVFQVYQHMQKAGPEFLLPIPPHGSEEIAGPGGVKPVHHNVMGEDPHLAEDRARLRAKIEEEERAQKVLEKPVVLAPMSSSSTQVAQPAQVQRQVRQQEASTALARVDVKEESATIMVVPPDVAETGRGMPLVQGGEDQDVQAMTRRNVVKKMMRHAWDNYVRYAWGKNELRPISKRGHSASIFGSTSLGATIVDGLDTLYIMDMKEEFEQARNWVAANLDMNKVTSDMSVFETNIRFIGGLLTCFALTGDTMFRDKAEHVAQKLLPAFQTPTGIPYALVNIRTGMSKNYAWASGGSSILSEFGTLHLEFTYLSDITGNPIYKEKVMKIRDYLQRLDKPKGLYPNYLNPKTGKWGQHHMSMGALGDSFYEYLLKAWLQSGKQDTDARSMYDQAMDGITKHLLQKSKSGLMYLSDMKFDRLEHKMDHLACFAGGLYGLGAHTLENDMSLQYMNIAKEIANTCHESYVRTATGLGPESFRFSDAMEAKALKSNEKYYILRPEVIESYFVLWRLTKDQKYRDWGWEAVQSLEKNCQVEGGYTGLKNVYLEDSPKDDVQQSFFLAETLKYLYLLFSDDSLIDLNEWVFNTEAHPLPVKGVNPLYRQKA